MTGEQANEADEQPRGKFGGFMPVGSAWLLAAYRRRSRHACGGRERGELSFAPAPVLQAAAGGLSNDRWST